MKNIKQRLIKMPLMIVAEMIVVATAFNTILIMCGFGKDWLLLANAMGKMLLAIGIIYIALLLIIRILAWGYKNERDDNI